MPTTLDPWDAHLDLRIEGECLDAECMHDGGFQYLWKGARATFGGANGKLMSREQRLRLNLECSGHDNLNCSRCYSILVKAVSYYV